MLWFKAGHLIAMVAWFAALFYLPRLFVYHAEAKDSISIDRFQLMERRLYYGIMWPAALITTFFGIVMIFSAWSFYKQAIWLHIKLTLVLMLWAYHLACGFFRKQFAKNQNRHSALFFRVYNEVPTLFLIAIILLAVLKPI